ncbi:hypothetical protein ABK040_002602 [Willaertia magna]
MFHDINKNVLLLDVEHLRVHDNWKTNCFYDNNNNTGDVLLAMNPCKSAFSSSWFYSKHVNRLKILLNQICPNSSNNKKQESNNRNNSWIPSTNNNLLLREEYYHPSSFRELSLNDIERLSIINNNQFFYSFNNDIIREYHIGKQPFYIDQDGDIANEFWIAKEDGTFLKVFPNT